MPGGIARVDTLGAESEEGVNADAPSLRLQARLQDLAGGARVGRALQDDDHPGMAVARDRLGGRVDVAHVRVACLGQRSRDRNRDRVAAGELFLVGGGLEAPCPDVAGDVG